MGDFSGTDILNEDGCAKTGFGGELDFGFEANGAQFYAGYQLSLHTAEGKIKGIPAYGIPDITGTGDWKFSRVVLGTRIMLSNDTTRIRPLIGGGVTIGKSTIDPTLQSGTTTSTFSLSSSTSMGLFFEGGMITRVGPGMDLLALLQYHRFEANMQGDLPAAVMGGDSYSSAMTVTYLAVRIGVAYHL